jgi:hypothetical protein
VALSHNADGFADLQRGAAPSAEFIGVIPGPKVIQSNSCLVRNTPAALTRFRVSPVNALRCLIKLQQDVDSRTVIITFESAVGAAAIKAASQRLERMKERIVAGR